MIEAADVRPLPWLQAAPITLFTCVMGLSGLTLVYQKGAPLLNFPEVAGSGLLVSSLLVFVLVTIVYLAKLRLYPQSICEEFQHPITLSYFPAISISLLLFSSALLPLYPGVAKTFWLVGSVTHLCFTLYVLSQWIHHPKFEVKHSTPAWFLPVVGNLAVPITGAQLGYQELSWFYFAIGVINWLMLQTLIFNRLIFHTPMPEKLLPSLFILVAPPALAAVSYLKLTGEFDLVVRLFYYTGLFMVLMLITQLRAFIKLDFSIAWWAYSFPLAAISLATLELYTLTESPFLLALAYGFVALISIIITLLTVKTLEALVDGILFAGED